MKVYILADLEGVSGVNHFDNWQMDNVGHQRLKARMAALMVGEVNAAVEGALAAGADLVVVRDGHGHSNTIPIEDLDPRARLSQGQQFLHPLPHLDASFDALVMVGRHARAGNPRGCLSHTYSRRIQRLCINDTEVGEIAINAALAGEMGIPAVFVSGDSEAVSEAKSFLSGIETVETKVSHSTLCALSLSPQMAREAIRQGVQRVLERLEECKPYLVPSPIELAVTYKRWYVAVARLFFRHHWRVARLTRLRTLIYHGDNLTETWQTFIGRSPGSH